MRGKRSLPLPAFYFDASDDNQWLVIDGLQRLCCFQNYIVDQKFRNQEFRLKNLEFLKKFEGCQFSELTRESQRRIEEYEITVYTIKPGTPKDVKFNLFRRINTGGLILNTQEIRNAVYQGIPIDFVNKLAELDSFPQKNPRH